MSDAADSTQGRVRRAPDAFSVWRGGVRLVQSARHARGVPATPLVLDVLDRLDDWTSIDVLAASLELPPAIVTTLVEGLAAHDLVVLEQEPPATASRSLDPGAPWDRWSPVAHLFQQGTRDVAFGRRASQPRPAASRPDPVLPPQGAQQLPLPLPRVPSVLARALRTRRTHRGFDAAPLTLTQVGTLLGATFGVQAWVHAQEGRLALKTSPSGGARHSLEAYVWIRHVDGVPPGLYHYRPDAHQLTRLDQRPAPEYVTRWLPVQDGYRDAPIVVVLASELARVGWRYGSARALRVVLIEAGHLAQTFCLTAAALDLAPFCTAALADSVIEADLGLDGEARPVVYAMGAGLPPAGPWRPHRDRPAPSITTTDVGEALGARVTRRASGPRRRRPHGSGR